MLRLIFLGLSALALVHSEPPVPQYGVPFSNNAALSSGYNNYNPGNIGHGVNNAIRPSTVNYDNKNAGYGQAHGGHDDHGEPKAYEFGYQVKDDFTGTNYNRQEQSDGNQVTGSYRVALPDGRTQIVTYYADWKTGFHADVRYEGEAQYPPPNNYNHNQIYNQNGNPHQGYPSYNNFNGNPPQYNVPVNPIAINHQYAALSSNQGATHAFDNYDHTQSYNPQTGNQHNYNPAAGNSYDSYPHSGYGNKAKPTAVYGAP